MPRGDFEVVTHPTQQPAVDFITRSPGGPFVDTGIDLVLRSRPGEPMRTERVYLAFDTIRQLAQLAGIQTEAPASGRDEALIAQGKIEALKEGLGDDISRLAGALVGILDAAGHGVPDRVGAEVL